MSFHLNALHRGGREIVSWEMVEEVVVSLVFWLNVISVYSGGMCCLAQIHLEKCLPSVEAEQRP